MLLRMAMSHTDGDDSGKKIQISVALVIEQVLHVALVEKQRFAVKQRGSRGKLSLSNAPYSVVRDVLKKIITWKWHAGTVESSLGSRP